MDVIKNYKFFSNLSRYYKKTKLLYVPERVFIDKNSSSGEKLKFDKAIKDESNHELAIKPRSRFPGMKLVLSDINLKKLELLEKIREKYPGSKRTRPTTKNPSLKK